MGTAEARKYIQELRRKQENPYLWPDFLTGLPDKPAILKKLGEAFPKLGKYSIAYVRIANIHPYLIKYGPDRHADIIEWAAGILKTTCEKCRNCFVGTVSTHDFIIMCESKDMGGHIREAGRIFKKRIEAYYSKEDLQKKTALSFIRNGERINVGLMRLITVIADNKVHTEKSRLIHDMGRVCEALETTDDDIVVMNNAMICK